MGTGGAMMGTEHQSLPSLDDAVREAMAAERGDSLQGPDGPEGRLLGALVGANVARERARRSFDLETLAERSAIRADLLALLEGGRAVPSLRAIWALATALEVPFGALLAHGDAPVTTFRVQRAG